LNISPCDLIDGFVLPVAQVAIHLIAIKFVGAGLAVWIGLHIIFKYVLQGSGEALALMLGAGLSWP